LQKNKIMAFKMKGAPMQRNFGIPLKNVETKQDKTRVKDSVKPEVEKSKTITSDLKTKGKGGLQERTTVRKGNKALRELKGRSAAGREFDKAFAKARKEGKETFTWRGKSYNTKLA
jgi:hypothetical protein